MRLSITTASRRMSVLFLLFGVGLWTASAQSAPHLKVWMESPRTEYKLCAQISIYLFVVNEDRVEVQVPYVDGRDRGAVLRLHISDDKGDSLKYTGSVEFSPEDPARLPPGDTAMFLISLIDTYHKVDFGTKYPPYIPVGQYTVTGVYFKEYPLQPLSFQVVPLNGAEESVLAGYTKVWNSPWRKDTREWDVNGYRQAFMDRLSTCFCSTIGAMLLLMEMPKNDIMAVRARDAQLILENCPEGKAALYAYALLLRSQSESEFKSTVFKHKDILQDRYTRFLLKGVLRVNKKSNLYDEVMKDVATNR